MKKKLTQNVNALDYPVVIALTISVITTFLLGMLLTDILFSTGLNYFAHVAEQGNVAQDAKARVVKSAPSAKKVPAIYDAAHELGYRAGLSAIENLARDDESQGAFILDVPEISDSVLNNMVSVLGVEGITDAEEVTVSNAYVFGYITAAVNYPDSKYIDTSLDKNALNLVASNFAQAELVAAGYVYDAEDSSEGGAISTLGSGGSCPTACIPPQVCEDGQCVDANTCDFQALERCNADCFSSVQKRCDLNCKCGGSDSAPTPDRDTPYRKCKLNGFEGQTKRGFRYSLAVEPEFGGDNDDSKLKVTGGSFTFKCSWPIGGL